MSIRARAIVSLLGLTIANWSFLVFASILLGLGVFLLQRRKTRH